MKKFSRKEMEDLVAAAETLDNIHSAINGTNAKLIDKYLRFKSALKLTAEEAIRQHEELPNGGFSALGSALFKRIFESK
jgi:hypothetical protein